MSLLLPFFLLGVGAPLPAATENVFTYIQKTLPQIEGLSPRERLQLKIAAYLAGDYTTAAKIRVDTPEGVWLDHLLNHLLHGEPLPPPTNLPLDELTRQRIHQPQPCQPDTDPLFCPRP